jgi:hypothetical protein
LSAWLNCFQRMKISGNLPFGVSANSGVSMSRSVPKIPLLSWCPSGFSEDSFIDSTPSLRKRKFRELPKLEYYWKVILPRLLSSTLEPVSLADSFAPSAFSAIVSLAPSADSFSESLAPTADSFAPSAFSLIVSLAPATDSLRESLAPLADSLTYSLASKERESS